MQGRRVRRCHYSPRCSRLREKGSNLRCRWLTATRSTTELPRKKSERRDLNPRDIHLPRVVANQARPRSRESRRHCRPPLLTSRLRGAKPHIATKSMIQGCRPAVPTCNCLLELNTAWLTSSPERSRGLFLNRHAPCSYVIFPKPKTTKAALSFRERRLRNSGVRTMASVTSLVVDHLRSLGLGRAYAGHGDGKARTQIGPIADRLEIQFF